MITKKLDEIDAKLSKTVNDDKQNYWSKENTAKEQFSDVCKDKTNYENLPPMRRFGLNRVNGYPMDKGRPNIGACSYNYRRNADTANYRSDSTHPTAFTRKNEQLQFGRGRQLAHLPYNGQKQTASRQQPQAQLERQRYTPMNSQTSTGTECNRCALVHHPDNCPAMGRNCLYCNGPNHFARRCRKRQNFRSE